MFETHVLVAEYFQLVLDEHYADLIPRADHNNTNVIVTATIEIQCKINDFES